MADFQSNKSVQDENTNPKPEKFQFNIETPCKIGFIILAIFGCFLFKKIYLFQTLDIFSPIKYGSFEDLLIGVGYAICLAVINYLVQYFLKDKMEPLIRTDKYQEPEARKLRYKTFAQFFYQTSYYFAVSFAAYFLIKDTNGFPTYLGGTGECINTLINYPVNNEANFYIKHFYLIQFGQSLRKLISHTFFKSDARYFEFVLHHLITILLIVFSYLMNYWHAGVMVMLVHDFSDAIIKIVRFYIDYRHKNQTVLKIMYVISVIIWIILRQFIFGFCCVVPTWQSLKFIYAKFDNIQLQFLIVFSDIFFFSTMFIAVMLTILQIMHIYWTVLFLRYFFMKQSIKKQIVS